MSSGSTAAESLSTCFQSVSPEWMAFLARFADTDQEIAYYPSAGLDFHPALYWKKEGMRLVLSEVPEGYSEPDLWIFSDYFHSGQPDLFDRDFLHRDDRTTMRFESICEISADPEHFLYRHNRNYTGHQSSALTGRAFYFRALVESHKLEPYHFDGIYFYYENVNLLDQFFLRHSVPVSHLVWKRDGAGFGGGKLKHEFLLPLSALMGTRWFYLSDQYAKATPRQNRWPAELENWRDKCPTSIDLHSLGEFQWDEEDRVCLLAHNCPIYSSKMISNHTEMTPIPNSKFKTSCEQLRKRKERNARQGPTGRRPAIYLKEMDRLLGGDSGRQLIRANPHLEDQWTRDEVRSLCLNPTITPLAAYSVAMAWGGQHFRHFRTSLGHGPKLDALLSDLRILLVDRSNAFELCSDSSTEIRGLGISFYTKLLFLFRPEPDACILDQWIAKALPLFFDNSPIQLSNWGGPDSTTTSTQYESYHQLLKIIGVEIGESRLHLVEELLFGRPRGEWRNIVRAHYEGNALDNAPRETHTRQRTRPSAQEDEHRVALAEHIRESHELALEGLSGLPASYPRLQDNPCRVYCGSEIGIQYYYYIQQNTVKAGAFFPPKCIKLYENLLKENSHPRHAFGPGITGNGAKEGKTRTISIAIPGGAGSPKSDWDVMADHAVEGMENIYRLLKPLKG